MPDSKSERVRLFADKLKEKKQSEKQREHAAHIENNQRRRFYLHESQLQEALYYAVRRAKIPKKVTAHTFRHSFATHLLQAGYDVYDHKTRPESIFLDRLEKLTYLSYEEYSRIELESD